MEQSGMTLTLDLGGIGSRSYETEGVAAIADLHPKLKIVICHLAQPTVRDEKSSRLRRLWADQIALAKRPNIWLDISALPHKVGEEPFPWPSSGRWIREALECAGPKKLLWGTDYPGLLTAGTYPQLLQQMSIHLAGVSSRHVKAILGENACAAYSLRKN
jgi:predicted TIM-barrel fold metal-dependent hydrolase